MPHDQPVVIEEAAGLLATHPWVPRRRLTVAEYYLMGEAGILNEDDRVELIEGELVQMSPIGSNHAGTVNALTYLLVHAVGERGVVTVQNPVRLDGYSEPQPDFLVLRPRADFYRGNIPLPDDVVLAIEVADSSLAYDRGVKQRLYARHGIAELWIVDLKAGRIEVCRSPGADGYAEIATATRGQTIGPALLPSVSLAVASILG